MFLSYFVGNGEDDVVGTADDEYKLRIHYIPSCVMWNPFDVTLEERDTANPTRVGIDSRFFWFRNADIGLKLTISGAKTKITEKETVKNNTTQKTITTTSKTKFQNAGNLTVPVLPLWENRADQYEASNVFNYRVKNQHLEIGPGEIRAYGLDNDVEVDWSKPSNRGEKATIPMLSSNYQPGYSAYYGTIDRPVQFWNGKVSGKWFNDYVKSKTDIVDADTVKITQTTESPFFERDSIITVTFDKEVITDLGNTYVEGVNTYPNGGIDTIGRFENLPQTLGMTKNGNFTMTFTPGVIAGNDNMQHILSFITRARGRCPEEILSNDESPDKVPKIPTQGGPGSFLNSVVITHTNTFWDQIYIPKAGFQPDEDFQSVFGSSSWGEFDVGVSGTPNSFVVYEMPRQPLVSIGQFKNVKADHPASMITMGNSWASPELSLDKVFDLGVADNANGVDNVVDDKWLNNDALFDGFFFSTVPPATRAAGTDYPAAWGNSPGNFTQSNVDAGDPLLNPRLKYVKQADGSAPDLANLRDMDTVTANLLLDGGFNINSTSVAAWRAVLASLRFPNASGAPVSRFVQNLSSAPTTENIEAGERVLTDAQVDALAVAIVEQVKLRGPFLTLADFVNRRLVNNELGYKGALQAAIDASGINNNARSVLGGQDFDLPAWEPGHNNRFSPSTRQGNLTNLAGRDKDPNTDKSYYHTAMGAPGMITQADLLQYLAPILAARSDTFAIRVFGEAGVTSPEGNYRLEGKAYGEAIVQRVPEFVDQTDSALTASNATLLKVAGNATPVDAVNAINQKLGRRFKVVSFRWLNPEEI